MGSPTTGKKTSPLFLICFKNNGEGVQSSTGTLWESNVNFVKIYANVLNMNEKNHAA